MRSIVITNESRFSSKLYERRWREIEFDNIIYFSNNVPVKRIATLYEIYETTL